MKHCAVLLFFFFGVSLSSNVFAQGFSPDPTYNMVKGESYVAAKNYYLLTLCDALPQVKSLLSTDPVLRHIATAKQQRLSDAIKNCNKGGLCFTSVMKFSDDEIKQVGDRLFQLYAPGNALDKLVKQHLIPCGAYILLQNESPATLLKKAWEQDAAGINFTIGVYGEGKKANYPNIDSIGFNVKDTTSFYNSYVTLLYNTASVISLEAANAPSFFSIPLAAALHFLELNEREQAADFEPTAEGENRLAVEKAKTLKWEQYPYSVILFPGAGPEERDVSLSAEAMLRMRLSALQYKNRQAPFIVVSGGKVHPYKTKVCEALEMKKYLVEKLGIPASAVIIEPHARHTATNLRNTVRLMYRYGFPMTKAGLTCTTRFQSNMIENTLVDRCQKELNEVPYKVGKRLTETEVEFYPLLAALQINPTEPMDP